MDIATMVNVPMLMTFANENNTVEFQTRSPSTTDSQALNFYDGDSTIDSMENIVAKVLGTDVRRSCISVNKNTIENIVAEAKDTE
ncbi:MAG: hypothetical protein RSC68_17310 [Acinetobacter sp.]